MKKLIFSMLAMAAMVSCSNEGDPINEINPPVDGEKVEIKLNAGVVGVETKAAIETWDAEGTKVQFAYGVDGINFTTAWNAIINSSNVVAFKAENFTDPEAHYYDSNIDVKTHLIGFYPNSAATTITNNQVPFTITGKEDIMATEKKVGDRSNMISGSFTFQHLLAQLKFKFAKGTGLEDGIKVTKIVVNGTKNAAVLELSDPTKLNFTAGVITALTAYEDETGETIPTAENTTMGSIMVEPGVSITLDITTTEGVYSGIAVTVDGESTLKSNAYTVTLTFSKKAVEGTAEVGAWTNKTGNADVN